MITITHSSIVNASHIDAALSDEHTKRILLAALDENPAQRITRAAELDRFAVHQSRSELQTLANVLRTLSAMDVAAIRQHVAESAVTA